MDRTTPHDRQMGLQEAFSRNFTNFHVKSESNNKKAIKKLRIPVWEDTCKLILKKRTHFDGKTVAKSIPKLLNKNFENLNILENLLTLFQRYFL